MRGGCCGAPDDLADVLTAELSALRRDRGRLAAELDSLTTAGPADADSVADATVDKLWNLGEELQRAKPERLRNCFAGWWPGSTCTSIVSSGESGKSALLPRCHRLTSDPLMCSVVSRGDWI